MRNFLVLFTTISLTVIMYSCSGSNGCGWGSGSDSTEKTYELVGYVKDEETGQAISNCDVHYQYGPDWSECGDEPMANEIGTTDEEGKFYIHRSFFQKGTLSISKNRYLDVSYDLADKTLEGQAGGFNIYHFTLTSCSEDDLPKEQINYSGVMVDSSMAPIANCRITYKAKQTNNCLDWGKRDTAYTDSSGRFSFPTEDNLDGAYYEIKCVKTGWEFEWPNNGYYSYIRFGFRHIKSYADSIIVDVRAK